MARHGETDWNREQRFQGHADPPLNDVGRDQARLLARRLFGDGIAAVYASPLRRALETAEIVAEVLGLPVETRLALREVDVGSWSGLTRTEVAERYPDGFRRWLDRGQGWDDGETYDDLGSRVVADLLELAARHPEERVLVVSHGGTMRAALAAVRNVPFASARRVPGPIGNGSIVVFAVAEDGLQSLEAD